MCQNPKMAGITKERCLHNIKLWRMRAEELLTKAEEYSSKAAQRTLVRLARDYERQAENEERRLAKWSDDADTPKIK